MENYYVFCDESGTPSKNDGMSHFVYTAILIPEAELEKARIIRQEACDKFLQGHKISSKGRAISSNFRTRINLLKHFCENLNFSVYTLIIDKSKLESDGLQIKQIFIKYFQKLLYGRIESKVSNFIVYMDAAGTEEFQKELKSYIYKKLPELQANLFSLENKFFLKSDDEEELIQLADLFSNSIQKIYSESHQLNNWKEIFDVIESKILKPQFFPYNSIVGKSEDSEYKVDTRIYESVVESIEKLNRIDKEKNTIIDYLLFTSRFLPQKLVETYELANEISKVLGYPIPVEKIRLHIRDLRYNGILIISKAGKSGYKLAVNEQDISSYFNHYLNYIIPMLEKANIADETLKLSLNNSTYNKIHKFLKVLKEP